MKLRFGNPLSISHAANQVPEKSWAGFEVWGAGRGAVEGGLRCKGEEVDPEVQAHGLEIGLPTLKGKLAVNSKP